MPDRFDLIITADTAKLTADFRLLDAHGTQLAYHQTEFKRLPVSELHALFDLRNYLRNYIVDGQEPAAVAALGVRIAEDVLGAEIFTKLYASKSQRTLRIQLPAAKDDANPLAAALARVPWEIARPSAGEETLAERNVLVRVVHDMDASASESIPLGPDEPLRVLFVFAEAQGSNPLGARRERRKLRQRDRAQPVPSRRIRERPRVSHRVRRLR